MYKSALAIKHCFSEGLNSLNARLFVQKSSAKVEVFSENRSHRCDLFVTSCDLMKIAGKRHKKSGLKRSLRVQAGYK